MAPVGRPPRLAVGHQGFEVGFQRVHVQGFQRLAVVKAGAQRIGFAVVLVEDVQIQRLGPPGWAMPAEVWPPWANGQPPVPCSIACSIVPPSWVWVRRRVRRTPCADELAVFSPLAGGMAFACVGRHQRVAADECQCAPAMAINLIKRFSYVDCLKLYTHPANHEQGIKFWLSHSFFTQLSDEKPLHPA